MQLNNLFLLDKIPVNQPHFCYHSGHQFIIPNYLQISGFLRKVIKQKFLPLVQHTLYLPMTDDPYPFQKRNSTKHKMLIKREKIKSEIKVI